MVFKVSTGTTSKRVGMLILVDADDADDAVDADDVDDAVDADDATSGAMLLS